MHSKPLSIQLPETEDGMVGRQCPRCQGKFAVHLQSFEDQCYLNLRCPYCKFIDEADRFLTGNQRAYLKAVGQDELLQFSGDLAGEILSDAFSGLSNSDFFELDTDFSDIDFGSRNIPSPELDISTERVSCPECAFGYALEEDRNGVCPVCR